jgi:hypothetical protein
MSTAVRALVRSASFSRRNRRAPTDPLSEKAATDATKPGRFATAAKVSVRRKLTRCM